MKSIIFSTFFAFLFLLLLLVVLRVTTEPELYWMGESRIRVTAPWLCAILPEFLWAKSRLEGACVVTVSRVVVWSTSVWRTADVKVWIKRVFTPQVSPFAFWTRLLRSVALMLLNWSKSRPGWRHSLHYLWFTRTRNWFTIFTLKLLDREHLVKRSWVWIVWEPWRSTKFRSKFSNIIALSRSRFIRLHVNLWGTRGKRNWAFASHLSDSLIKRHISVMSLRSLCSLTMNIEAVSTLLGRIANRVPSRPSRLRLESAKLRGFCWGFLLIWRNSFFQHMENICLEFLFVDFVEPIPLQSMNRQLFELIVALISRKHVHFYIFWGFETAS